MIGLRSDSLPVLPADKALLGGFLFVGFQRLEQKR